MKLVDERVEFSAGVYHPRQFYSPLPPFGERTAHAVFYDAGLTVVEKEGRARPLARKVAGVLDVDR